MAGAAMAGTPGMTSAAPTMSGGSGSNMDESLAQVQAAMAGNVGGCRWRTRTRNRDSRSTQSSNWRNYLRQNGLQASARVDQLEDTGRIVGDERVYKMQMTLTIPGQPPQQLPASAAMVPVGVSHKLFRGMTVPVRYAAENHDLLMVEWDKV